MTVQTTLPPRSLRPLLLRALGWIRAVAWFDLALGLVVLGYGAWVGFTLQLLRGGLVLTGVGLFGLVFFGRLQRRLTSPA